jgi:hypothetical protein
LGSELDLASDRIVEKTVVGRFEKCFASAAKEVAEKLVGCAVVSLSG